MLRELEEETGLAGRRRGDRRRPFEGLTRDGSPTAGRASSTRSRSSTGSRSPGGTLRDEPEGSTDRAAWLTRDELAADGHRADDADRRSEIAFGEGA